VVVVTVAHFCLPGTAQPVAIPLQLLAV
jgi:hypothetical protein